MNAEMTAGYKARTKPVRKCYVGKKSLYKYLRNNLGMGTRLINKWLGVLPCRIPDGRKLPKWNKREVTDWLAGNGLVVPVQSRLNVQPQMQFDDRGQGESVPLMASNGHTLRAVAQYRNDGNTRFKWPKSLVVGGWFELAVEDIKLLSSTFSKVRSNKNRSVRNRILAWAWRHNYTVRIDSATQNAWRITRKA